MKYFLLSTLLMILCFAAHAQVVINEGSNMNYTTIADEDGTYPDWIELYNTDTSKSVNLLNYILAVNGSTASKWVMPYITLPPRGHQLIFCSSKNRVPFTHVLNTGTYKPKAGWNTHTFTTPFHWDGVSNIVINICSYSSAGSTSNSIFYQSATTYASTLYATTNSSNGACTTTTGTTANMRPNIQLNGIQVGGTDTLKNGDTTYPAPYGNAYAAARHQVLIRASDMIAASFSAGTIYTLGLDVAVPDAGTYDYIDISMNNTADTILTSSFASTASNNYHTNFSISSSGKIISLYYPSQVLSSSLWVNCTAYNTSKGLYPDGVKDTSLFQPPTPGATNDSSGYSKGYALAPVLLTKAGLYNTPFSLTLSNPNGWTSKIYYTLDGSDPDTSATLFTNPIYIYQSTVVKAKAYVQGQLASPLSAASYFFNVSHVTPVLSVITDNINLYGASGIFDNYDSVGATWLKPAYVEYFDSTSTHKLIFSQIAGMEIDGGDGGSRSQPQHSFRIELSSNLLGAGSINYQLIPGRPNRTKYGEFYVRNGSNQYLVLPYKDAALARMSSKLTHNYYAEWRPVSVYINGQYFGLYEVEEKFDAQMFETLENAAKNSISILSQSYFNGSILQSVAGDAPDSFFSAYNKYSALNTTDTLFWNNADKYFDMIYYNDYIIAESWVANTDWLYNNIKIYSSNTTNYNWRFCPQDLELGMSPNGWTTCTSDMINYMMNYGNNPYIGIWQKGLQNDRFRNYFINRYADVMNTYYDSTLCQGVDNTMFNQTVAEMGNEYARWGNPNNVPAEVTGFYNSHVTMQQQLGCRSAMVRDNIQSDFALPRQVNVTLNVYPAGAGTIHISTITPGPYPWKGVYFDGVPVTITATANPGYTFLHWGTNPLIADTFNARYNDTLHADSTKFIAYFKALPNAINNLTNTADNYLLYPSPAQNTVYLLNKNTILTTSSTYSIVDLNGRVLQQGQLSAKGLTTPIDIQSLTGGIYFIRIENDAQVLRYMKFVKM